MPHFVVRPVFCFCSIALVHLFVFASQINCYSVGLNLPSESGEYQDATLSRPAEEEQPTNKTGGISSEWGREVPRDGAICAPHQLFHNDTKACYDNGLQAKGNHKKTVPNKKNAPCGELMYLYPSSQGSPFVVCKCIGATDPCSVDLDFHRPVLNWPKSNRCYFAYAQGPCKRDQWLILNKNTFQSECILNPCLNRSIEKVSNELRPYDTNPEINIFRFLRNGTCYQTFTQAYCKSDEYVRFIYTDPVPKCLPRSSEFGIGCPFVGTTAGLPCPQGHKSVESDCSPIAEFE